MRVTRIAILQPADPAGHVPSGIDSFIRGILRWAPDDLEYIHYGASSDLSQRPIGQTVTLDLNGRRASFMPIVDMDAHANRSRIPLSIRYIAALRGLVRRGELADCDILDFHRIEPLVLFRGDSRAKNVVIHQDMTVIRDASSDILWRYAPWMYESIEHWLFRRVDRVFCVRQTAVQRYKRTYTDIAERFAFIPTWVDPEVFHPASSPAQRAQVRKKLLDEIGASEPAKVLIFVGRLDRQKDPLLLLQSFKLAAKRHPDARLAIVGDGLLRAEVEAISREPEIAGRVTLLGTRRPAEISQLLQASDLFVLSSAYEGMPFAVLEALATGLPVATTAVGELNLVVKHGVNGTVCTEKTPESFSAALCTALEGLERFRGKPCLDAVAAFHPRIVLRQVYENHRMQAGQRKAA